MSISLICPFCGGDLYKNIFKLKTERAIVCKNCTTRFNNYDGCFDFTCKSQEKKFYEERYVPLYFCEQKDIDLVKLRDMWYDTIYTERRVYIEQLGSIKNKDILLLGNGESLKELYFLKFGNRIMYTDISLNAVRSVRNKYNWRKYQDKIVFHAVDAYNIPLNNETIDIVIGYAFVHHLDNLDLFFQEIYRILKPGGKCLFYDAAYSRIWQKLKFSLLKPFVYLSHKRSGISPEDLRATQRGGYHRQEIEDIKVMYNFKNMTFMRFGLLYQIFSRAMEKFCGYNKMVGNIKGKVIPILFSIDNHLADLSCLYHNNTMNLVWGFRK